MSERTAILIVEDDEAIASGLTLNLELEGFASSIVGDGEAALVAARESEPPSAAPLRVAHLSRHQERHPGQDAGIRPSWSCPGSGETTPCSAYSLGNIGRPAGRNSTAPG